MPAFSKITTKILLAALVLVSGVGILHAAALWTGPQQTPPLGNTNVPINTGSANQAKAGPLEIEGDLTSTDGVCLGGECRTSWPSVGISDCNGPNKALQYDGKNWLCRTLTAP